jgi:hypothetical protein
MLAPFPFKCKQKMVVCHLLASPRRGEVRRWGPNAEELSERIEIKRAWEKRSRLPSPLLKFNRD